MQKRAFSQRRISPRAELVAPEGLLRLSCECPRELSASTPPILESKSRLGQSRRGFQLKTNPWLLYVALLWIG